MKLDRQQLARTATAKALQIRKRIGVPLWEPICVYDCADRLGVDVRFIDIASMEGAYCLAGHPAIIISSLRPPGRQVFTGAHELGHHVFGHGDQYDDLVETRSELTYSDPREFTAECFAGAFLMPKIAVDRGFAVRGFSPHTCSPEGIFAISSWLGVGYTTLIHHMRHGLGTLNAQRADQLLRASAKSLRSSLIGQDCPEHLVFADLHWTGRAIDVQIADLILLPHNVTVEGKCMAVARQTLAGTLLVATKPGVGRVHASGTDWAAFVRVTRKEYVGRGKYRFEEEIDDVD